MREFALQWRPRAEPLAPSAAAAWGPAAVALARRVLARDDEALARLSGVAGEEVLVLLGEPEALPWADGVLYLGRDPQAQTLLVPTNQEPSVPLPLVERAVRARWPEAGPCALLPAPGVLVPVGQARQLARDVLAAWVEQRG
jgi:hypothetical protein